MLNGKRSAFSTGRAGKIYNYYINQGFKQGKYKKNEVLVRIPSNKIETFVTSKVAEFLKNTKIIQKIINDYSLNIQAEILKKLSRITINKDIITQNASFLNIKFPLTFKNRIKIFIEKIIPKK